MFKSLYRTDLPLVTVYAGLLLAGCSRDGSSAGALPEALPPVKAGAKLEQTFVAATPADPAVKQQLKTAATALKHNDVLAAYDALQQLKAVSSSMTLEQDMAVRNAIFGVSEAIARGVAAGDPKAIAIAKEMQKSR